MGLIFHSFSFDSKSWGESTLFIEFGVHGAFEVTMGKGYIRRCVLENSTETRYTKGVFTYLMTLNGHGLGVGLGNIRGDDGRVVLLINRLARSVVGFRETTPGFVSSNGMRVR